MTRRRFFTIVAVGAAANIVLLFAFGFSAIGGDAEAVPNGSTPTVQMISRTAVDALLAPAIWLFRPTENTSVLVGGSVILANSLVWGIIIAIAWALIRKRGDAAF